MWQWVDVGPKGPVFKILPSGLLQKSLMISITTTKKLVVYTREGEMFISNLKIWPYNAGV